MVRLAVLMGAVAAVAAPIAAVSAADMTVSGTVGPVLGISPSSGERAGTLPADVTREQRGDVVVITVFPR